jgi:CheY-like chemotaxis protein
MARRMAAFDWERTPLGTADQWPSALRMVVRMVLASPIPMWLTWGPEGTFFYNDACAAVALGARHPWALGRPAPEVWGESWHAVQASAVRRSADNLEDSAVPFLVDRDGVTVEVHLGFSCTPLESLGESAAGSLWMVDDRTQAVFSRGRSRVLQALTRTVTPATSERAVFEAIESVLGADSPDMPFTLTYLLRSGEPELVSWTGLTAGQVGAIPADFARRVRGWATTDVQESVVVPSPVAAGGRRSAPPPRTPARIAVVPLLMPGATSAPIGVFIGAMSPLRPGNADYLEFVKSFALICAVALSVAGERVRAEQEVSAEATRADRALGAIAHDLRAPLNTILAWSQILAGDVAPGNQRRGLETIARSARAQAQLLDGLVSHTQAAAAPPPALPSAAAARVPDLGDLVILVVDDEDDARAATAQTLKVAGAEVIEAGSAQEGWERLEERPVALILSDITMPDVDGYSFMMGVRNRPELAGDSPPAIALTSRGGSVDRQHALRSGFQMHLTKPVESTELILACASLTGRLLPH